MFRKTLFAGLAAVMTSSSVFTATFYVDPATGSMAGDGSEGSPWSTMDSVWSEGKIEMFYGDRPYSIGDSLNRIINEGAPVKGGDTLLLLSGHHGKIEGNYGRYNKEFVTVMRAPGHRPTMERFSITASSKWRVQGLVVSPSFAADWSLDSNTAGGCIQFLDHGYNGGSYENEVIACTVFTEWDATAWTEENWWLDAVGGIKVTQKSLIRNCHIKNCVGGPYSTGDSSLYEYNLVENFSTDGLRMQGTGNVFQYNVIKGCINCSDNHDDAIQCYPSSNHGVLRGNIIIEFDFVNNDWGATDTLSRPFSGPLQGLFGGPWDNGLIENNLVLVDHWHGISMGGDNTENNRVINNTVIDLVPGNERVPWIRNTSTGTGHITRNNVGHSASGPVSDHNFLIGSTPLADLFEDPDNYDFRPKAGSALIDSGSADGAPALDLNETSRPQGNGIDPGAYEYVVNAISSAQAVPAAGLDIRNPIPVTGLRQVVLEKGLSVFRTDGKQISQMEQIGPGYYFIGTEGGVKQPVMVVE